MPESDQITYHCDKINNQFQLREIIYEELTQQAHGIWS